MDGIVEVKIYTRAQRYTNVLQSTFDDFRSEGIFRRIGTRATAAIRTAINNANELLMPANQIRIYAPMYPLRTFGVGPRGEICASAYGLCILYITFRPKSSAGSAL
jgi:hypothetical protein